MNAHGPTREELARLATLHDIVEPAAISFWPVAPGWWLVAVLLLLLIIRLGQQAWRHWQRDRYRRSALRSLRRLEARRHALPHQQTLQAALAILHDCARSMTTAGPDDPPLPSDSAAWIDFLRARVPASQPAFPETLLRDAAYWPPERVSATDASALLHFVRSWIINHECPA